MDRLPSGTVTFLFADIEGSTRLLHELGERYVAELAEYRRKLREAFAANGGVEVDTQGDGFFVAFASPTGALAAAAAAQEALGSGPVAARMGIHTGEPIVWAEGYAGLDVHRGARICAAAHGGQVVVSGRTRELVDVPLRELGSHRLKDLSEPQPLYQLGTGEFPPLKTLYATNLPVQSTPLLGRSRELEEAGALLAESRVVTFTGPGGSGKTRLALHVAADSVQDFRDGVWWVPLQTLNDPALVPGVIAQALGARDGLAQHIRDKQLLLLLDNFEQLLGGAGAVAEVIEQAPDVKVLVTSREPLRIRGERRYPVQPLTMEDAEVLFLERARAVDPTFEPTRAVAEICRRLDGLPLAIELAAARVGLLGPDELLARLERTLPMLSQGARDVPDRQRTLRATIEWSYDLLDPEERRLFARLAVFAASFELAAAEAVCEVRLEVLQSLVDKSLVRRWASGRLGMLETIREYAAERLEASGEGDELRREHAEWFLALAERLEPGFWDSGHASTVDRFVQDHENVRGAIAWSFEAGAQETFMRLVASSSSFWIISGQLYEARPWLERALACDAAMPGMLRATLLTGTSAVAHLQGDYEQARVAGAHAVALCRDLGDDALLAHAANRLANALKAEGDHTQARSLYEEAVALARRAGDARGLGVSLVNVASLSLEDGRYQETRQASEEARTLFESLGNMSGLAMSLLCLGRAAVGERRDADAVEALAASIRLYSGLGRGIPLAGCFEALAAVVVEQAPAAAVRLLAVAEVLREDAGARATPDEQRLREQALEASGRRLGAEEVDGARREGRELVFEDAVEYALRVAAGGTDLGA